MKIISFLAALFVTATTVAQQPIYSSTTNNLNQVGKEASFTVSIVPDQVVTAFRLFVQNPDRKKIDIQITHRELGLLADTSFTNEQFGCRYNFEQVQDGYYQLTLINGKEKVTKNIEINTISRRQVVIR